METFVEKQDRQWRGVNPDEATQALIDQLVDLPPAELLKLLRAAVPLAADQLPSVERKAFFDELCGQA